MSKRERKWLARLALVLAFIFLVVLVLLLREQTAGQVEMYRATLDAIGRGW